MSRQRSTVRGRNIAGPLAAIGLLLAIASAVGAATLTGRLVNKTAGGQGVNGVEVTLTTSKEGREAGKRTARTEREGRFRFAGLEVGKEWSHSTSVSYQGGEYLADPVTFDTGTPERAIEIPVYDATTDPRALGVKLHHVIFDQAQEGLRVTEVLVVRNPKDRTYVGDRALADGRRATLRFTLPAGATDIRYGDGLMDCCAVPGEGGFADTMAVKPGGRQVAFTYSLGRGGQGIQFVRPLDYPTDAVDLFVPEGTKVVSSSGLQAAGMVSGGNGKRYARLAGGPHAPPARVAVTFEGLPAAGRGWWPVGVGLGAFLVAAAGLYPFIRWGWRRGLTRMAGTAVAPDLARRLRAAELRAALAALEEARAAGSVAAEDYRRLAAERQRALEDLALPAKEAGPTRRAWAGHRLWWVGAGLVIAGIAGGFLLVGLSGVLSGSGDAPRLGVTPVVKDFGEVRRDAGRLEAVFTLRNEGKAPLRIARIVPT